MWYKVTMGVCGDRYTKEMEAPSSRFVGSDAANDLSVCLGVPVRDVQILAVEEVGETLPPSEPYVFVPIDEL